MDSFLDSCVIINFIQYKESDKEVKKKCFDYINLNIKAILIGAYVNDEIKKYLRKKEVQYNEIINKKENTSHKIGSSKEAEILSKDDLLFTEKLYDMLQKEDTAKVKTKLLDEIKLIRFNFNVLVKNIKEMLKENFDQNITNILRDTIEDYADCRVLSSALLSQQKRAQFIFVTADRHFAPNIYDSAKEDKRLENYNFPDLKNFLYE